MLRIATKSPWDCNNVTLEVHLSQDFKLILEFLVLSNPYLMYSKLVLCPFPVPFLSFFLFF